MTGDKATRKHESSHVETPAPKRPRKFFVKVERDPAVEKIRQELPVCMHEQEIIEAIHENDVILITGATGTGKTTQVPQFLIEDGFGHPSSTSSPGMIAVTQPRRIAAITCANRVAQELNTTVGKSGGLVGYQVRHDSKISDSARIKFSTDGIILREVEHDILLRKYSAIIIDEAHERSLNTDLLLSFLSRSVLLRRQKKSTLGLLKIIIMSATLDVDGILSGNNPLFPNPPVVKVPSRQYPITIHFSKHTFEDYVEEAFRKVSQIHTRLPPGGILVFLSGREEVERLCAKLQDEFGNRTVNVNLSSSAANLSSNAVANDKATAETTSTENEAVKTGEDEILKQLDESPKSSEESPEPSKSTIVEVGVRILPFYSLLPDHLQRQVFQKVEDTPQDDTQAKPSSVTRKVVIATNIAETSVTVPDITYVVDSGRAKEKIFKGEGLARMSAYEVRWISRASAEQRSGRAGRTSAGHCYRLYSSAVYDQQFVGFRSPEILRVPTDSVVLRLRAMGILHVAQFPFATAPPRNEIIAAERLLTNLGALSSLRSSSASQKAGTDVFLGVTTIGRTLATLPLEPRLGRLLLAAKLDGKLNTIALACRLGGVLSVGTMFQNSTDKNIRTIQAKLRNAQSDLLTELAALCAVEHAGRIQSAKSELNKSKPSIKPRIDTQAMRSMCNTLGLHKKCVLEAIAVAKQVERTIGQPRNDGLRPPDKKGAERLLRAVVAGYGDRVARRLSRDEAAAAGVIPKFMNRAFVVPGVKQPVFIEGASSVHIGWGVNYVCYSELIEMEVKRKVDEQNEDSHDDYDDNDSDGDDADQIFNALSGKGVKGNGSQNQTDEKMDADKKSLKNKKVLAQKHGGSRNFEKRIVMRGVSIIEPSWIIEEAEGMCEMKVVRDLEPEYDERMESVTETMVVSYKGKGWVLGRKKVPVDEVEAKWDPGAVNPDRRAQYTQVFTKALVTGKVRRDMRLSKEEVRLEICRGKLSELLRQSNLFSLQQLTGCDKSVVNSMIETVDLCCYKRSRADVLKRWRQCLHQFGSKLETASSKDGENMVSFDREESESDDDY